jgi:hypothetical protein
MPKCPASAPATLSAPLPSEGPSLAWDLPCSQIGAKQRKSHMKLWEQLSSLHIEEQAVAVSIE